MAIVGSNITRNPESSYGLSLQSRSPEDGSGAQLARAGGRGSLQTPPELDRDTADIGTATVLARTRWALPKCGCECHSSCIGYLSYVEARSTRK
jgi:hypothetical protein